MKSLNTYSDEKILEIIRSSSPEADRVFEILFDRFSSKLNAFCIFRTDSIQTAEEIFEDTWLKFLDKVRNGKVVNNVLAYLYTIARNLIIDRFRHDKSEKAIGIDYREFNEIDSLVNPFDFTNQYENEELMSLIRIAVSSLDVIYRETFIMHWFGGLSQKEISEILGISLSNVKMRNHRAMSQIIKILKPHFADSSF